MAMFLMALVTAFVGAIPLLARKRAQEAAILVVVAMGVSWCVYYLEMPSLVWPFYGVMGGMVVVWWSVAAIADAIAEDAPTKIAWFPLVGLLLFVAVPVVVLSVALLLVDVRVPIRVRVAVPIRVRVRVRVRVRIRIRIRVRIIGRG